MNDDDRYITSFLFPTERTAFVPDTNSVNEEKRRLEKSLVSGAFQCPKCLKTFSRSSNLVRHQATVACDPDVTSQQASLQCEKCLKTFTKASNLKRHQAGAGCEPGVSLQCEKCLRTFTLASKLKRHQAGAGCEPGVSQQASLQCEKCLKTFTKAGNMKRHGAGTCNGVSTARATFPCHLCSKTFASSRFLDRHIRNKHSNKCPHCGKCFDTKDNLAKHARKHLNKEYLTVHQARTLRKIAGKSATVSAAQRRSTCTGSVAGPSGCDHQSPEQNHPAFRQSIKRIHGNAGVVFTIKPSGAEKHSLLEMFSGKRSHFNWNLTEQLNRWTNTRWYMAVNARMLRFDSEGNIRDEERPTFRSQAQVLLTADDISSQIDLAFFKINSSLETFCCLTLRDKSKYTLHYRNLQFYVRHGLRVTRVHRVLTFTQVPFLENFMKHCSEQRMSARAPLYRKMWKNISNLVAGKSYENPRNYTDVRICTSSESVKRYVSKTTFDCLRVFHENLTAVQLHRPIVMLSKPITVGFCVLELSKLAVYSFYYDFVKTDLAKGGKVAFLSGDTDSFVIKTTGVSDLDDRYKKAMHLFDFSNLPETHPLKSDHNRMVPGKLKFELPGHVCCEFVALSPKCYSMQTDKGFKQARKGCSRELRHELYKECLVSGSCHQTNVKEIRHYGQKLYQVSVTKKVLNVLDTKRYHFNAVDSVSFGHCSLGNEHS
ncbi:uncharacterized protein LOC123535347 [Mercenaria mercenaria]|uniref:uncharacterized protein LOC123535347 n=1 Tax=Mercenaria mercenaria TaxID=6596 RepID=UPI00234EC052|nr:uncharacterized protein LOC123535347 [Mercenaria mercenaria]